MLLLIVSLNFTCIFTSSFLINLKSIMIFNLMLNYQCISCWLCIKCGIQKYYKEFLYSLDPESPILNPMPLQYQNLEINIHKTLLSSLKILLHFVNFSHCYLFSGPGSNPGTHVAFVVISYHCHLIRNTSFVFVLLALHFW